MPNQELHNLAMELCSHTRVIICPDNNPNSITYSQFLQLKEILFNLNSKTILEYRVD
jgi:hypothetical protein